MKDYILNNLNRNKFQNVIFIIAFILIFVFLPISVSLLQNVKQQVEADVTHFARGTYDILVRPAGKEDIVEIEKGLVHENYIGFGEGGITLAEWQEIKNLPDVEIAAPVAALGSFTGVKSNVGIEPHTKSTRYLVQFTTSDGVNIYNVESENICILLESPNPDLIFFKYETLINDRKLLNSCNDVANFALPSTYHFIVGIDPEEEEKLTGIEFDYSEQGLGHAASRMLKNDLDLDVDVVPIIEIEYDDVSLGVNVVIDTLDITKEDTQQLRERMGLAKDLDDDRPLEFLHLLETKEYWELFRELSNLPEINRIEFTANLGGKLEAFQQQALLIHKDGSVDYLDLKNNPDFVISRNLNFATSYYQSGLLDYEIHGEELKVKIKDYRDGVPVYREVIEEGAVFDAQELDDEEFRKNIKFVSDPIGTVTIDEYQETLASSPLGIYQFAPVYYYDKEKDEKIRMTPTVTPGSFVTPAAKGVTTIEMAEKIKGDAPIDAIRVKVAGPPEYTKESVEIIERVASYIENMGLKVNIIAGASPQKLEVEVEGIGTVEESWTTLGAAGTIVNEWNMTNLILSILFIIVAITFVINKQLFWNVRNRKDQLLFTQLGWDKKYISKLYTLEMVTIIAFSYLISLGVLGFVSTSFTAGIFIWHVIILISTLILSLVILNWKLNHLQREEISRIRRIRTKSFVLQNIFYFRKFIQTPAFQLMMVSALSTFVYLSLTETTKITSVTLLGEYINTQTGGWTFLLIVVAYLLALSTLTDSIFSLMKAREKEIGIYRSIGWSNKNIFTVYFKEMSLWTGISILIGTLISGIAFGIVYSITLTEIAILAGSFIGFYVLVIVLMSYLLMQFLTKGIADNLVIRRNKRGKVGLND